MTEARSPINLPVYDRSALDYSILSTHQRCPRKALFRYWHGRAPLGINYAMEFGTAYHRYREVLEKGYLMAHLNGLGEAEPDAATGWHLAGISEALEKYPENPPSDHNKSYLTQVRLEQTCEAAFLQWKKEKEDGMVRMVAVEHSFQLELPSGEQYGGKMDQIIEWNGKVWIRDFKHTTRKGRTYANAFDPHDQFTGYVWAARQLTGRRCWGVIVGSAYNTSRVGPELEPFLVTRTDWDIDDWLNDVQAEIANVRMHEASGKWPKRTVACQDFGGCFFREVCGHTHSWREQTEWLENKTQLDVWDFAAKENVT